MSDISFKTPERVSATAALWVLPVSMDHIREQINALPGRSPIPDWAFRDWMYEAGVRRNRDAVIQSKSFGGKQNGKRARFYRAVTAKPKDDRRDSWPDETLASLRRLWSEGHSCAEIGRRIGRSKNSIVGKVHRQIAAGLLTGRPSPIIRDGEPHEPRVQIPRAPRVTLPKLQSEAAELPRPARPKQNFPPPVVLLPPARPVPVPVVRVARPPGKEGCRFPLWGHTEKPSHHYCDQPTVELGSPWCAEHRKRCFNRVTLTARADAA